MSNPNALLLLADHIKLSLLERQRAKTLNLSRDSQDGHISRSLDQLREGIETLTTEHTRLSSTDEAKANALLSTLTTLRKQHTDLSTQFHGFPSPSTNETLTSPNDPSLASSFAHAQSKPTTTTTTTTKSSKTVRFSSPRPSTDLEAQHNPPQGTGQGNPLFPYRDDPETAGYRDQIATNDLSNTQIHAYHEQILAEQDAQLDALGASISRQRELSMRIGDELDEQVIMLDESERVVDRHQSTLDRARRQVGKFAREAGESRQMVAIVVLIVILVLLIAILK